jgi:hypothetical protein
MSFSTYLSALFHRSSFPSSSFRLQKASCPYIKSAQYQNNPTRKKWVCVQSVGAKCQLRRIGRRSATAKMSDMLTANHSRTDEQRYLKSPIPSKQRLQSVTNSSGLSTKIHRSLLVVLGVHGVRYAVVGAGMAHRRLVANS